MPSFSARCHFPKAISSSRLDQHDMQGRDANRFVAPVRLEDWNRLNSTFQAISGYYLDDLSETSGPLPEKVTEASSPRASFRSWASRPRWAASSLRRKNTGAAPMPSLISYGFWQRRFHGAPDVIGKKLHIGSLRLLHRRRHARIVPVSQPRRRPLGSQRSRRALCATPRCHMVHRHRPDEARRHDAAGHTPISTPCKRSSASNSPSPTANSPSTSTPLKEIIVGGVRSSLWLLYGSVSLLLLIACSNIAALLLARTAEREHEISIRFSLGASRIAIIVPAAH